MRLSTRFVVTIALAAGLAASVGARAEETNHLWPQFAVAVGSYQVSSSDKIKIDGKIERLGREVNLDADFGLPDRKSPVAAGFQWAFAERHSVGVSYYALNRGVSRSISRDIQIGDTVFPIGASAALDFKETTVEANYDYWFVRHEKFGFGGSFGLIYLALDAKATASYRFGNSGETTTARASASTDLPVPMIGFVVKGSPWHWLVLSAGARYLPSLTVDKISGEAASYVLAADFYVYGPLAIGGAWAGTFYKVDLKDSSWHGSIDLGNEGFQIYLRAGW